MTVLPEELQNAPGWATELWASLPQMVGYRHIAKATGMHWGTIANAVSKGTGPTGGIILGRTRIFTRTEAVQWLISRAAQNEGKYARKGG